MLFHSFFKYLNESTQQYSEFARLRIFFSQRELIVERSIFPILLSGSIVEMHIFLVNYTHLESIFIKYIKYYKNHRNNNTT